MTATDATKVIAYLRAMWPRQDLSDATVAGYCEALREVDFASAMTAARRLVATARFWPTISELLAPIADAQVGLEPAEQAWLTVKRTIRIRGRYREWKFDNPAITLAVESLGKEALCNADETMIAERAHFMRIYESYRGRELDEARTAPLLGRTYRRLEGPRPSADVLRLVSNLGLEDQT